MSYGPIEVTRDSCFPNDEILATRMSDMLAMRVGDMLATGVTVTLAVEISINYATILENPLHLETLSRIVAISAITEWISAISILRPIMANQEVTFPRR